MIPLAATSLPYILLKLHSVQAIGVVAVLLALYYAVVTAIEKWRVHRTRGWPTAVGTISDVNTEYKSEPNGVDYRRVHFVYTYLVQGTEYTGKYHVNCVTEKLAQAAVEGISNGQAIVHYNPAKPAESVLWEDEVWKLW